MKKSFAFAAASLLLMAVAACAPNQDSGQGTGLAKVSVALELADVAKVELTATPEGGGAPITVEMIKDDLDPTHYTAAFNAPAGTYTFTANALNNEVPPVVLASGSAVGVVVAPPGPILVYIVLHEPNPPVGPTKKLPQVSSVVATPASVAPGGTSDIAVVATSPEGHVLSYAWTDSCGGVFGDAGAASTVWTAPGTEGECLLSVKVTDSTNDTSVTVYIKIIIIIIIVPVDANAVLDTYPIVTLGTLGAFIVDAEDLPVPGLTVGITADLVATASDPDGGAVTYLWTSTCTGTFTPDASTLNVQFHAEDPLAKCTLTLTVTDTPPGAPYPAGTPQTIQAIVVLTE